MRVLQLISSAGVYGAETVLLELCQHLLSRGHQVQLGVIVDASAEGSPLARAAARRGVPSRFFPSRGRADPRVPVALGRFLARQGVQVAHSHGYKADLALGLALLGGRVDAVTVSTCHGWLSESPKLLLYEGLDKAVLTCFHHVAGVSADLLRQVREAGVARERSSLVANGLDPAPCRSPGGAEALRRELGVEPGEALLLNVGRMDRYKAQGRLLQAAALLRQRGVRFRLAVVGTGPLLGELEQQVRTLGLQGVVRLAGYREDLACFYQAADLLVQSSIREGMPMVLLEGMAAGLPLVATAVGEVPRLLEEGRAGGVLVPPDDPEALAGAVSWMLADPERRRRLARAGHERYRRSYSREAMGESYLALYRRLLGERP